MSALGFCGRDTRVSDGPENYEILEEINRSGISIVYLAICKRGRLRDRKVALKKIPRSSANEYSTSVTASLESSTLIHQALHHPAIMSLLSTFTTESFHYHVMELCPHKTLSNFLRMRNPPVLSEAELRGLAKTLVDVLIYLKKEHVIHRNIQAATVLVTDDYHVKLSKFRLATRLPLVRPIPYGPTSYSLKKVNSGTPCDFSTDLWSLGCLMITCLSGTSLFEANPVLETSQSVSDVLYALPSSISPEAKDLILNLLGIVPEQRMPLESILSHSFFDAGFAVHSLRPVPHNDEGNLVGKTLANTSKMTLPHPSSLTSPSDGEYAIQDMENTDMRYLLKKEISSNAKGYVSFSRRVVSDPLPRQGSLASEFLAVTSRARTLSTAAKLSVVDSQPFPSSSGSRNGGGGNLSDTTSIPTKPRRTPNPFPKNHTTPMCQNLACIQKNFAANKENLIYIPPSHQETLAKHKVSCLNASHSHSPYTLQRKESLRSVSDCSAPIGTTRPVQLNMSPLRPQTQKTVHGQLTILPSLSLLVDFREGERRKGRRGDEVFVVNPDGSTVKIYSAPHLSSPCLLAEPITVYPIKELPPCYWKQHNDACKIIEQIKQVTPMLVMYNQNAKCTLMSNVPQGDIEIIYPCPPPSVHQKARRITESSAMKDESLAPRMRVRLSRHHHSVEIARLSTIGHPQSMGEWTKKIFNAFDRRTGLREADWSVLDDIERTAMKDLQRFVGICEIVEGLPEEKFQRDTVTETSKHWGNSGDSQDFRNASVVSSSVTTRGPLAFTVAPRPMKLSTILSKSNACAAQEPESSKCTLRQISNQADITDRSQWSRGEFSDELNRAAGIQTQFLPSVGWCIRYGSRVSQGGRYRIMFLDGVTLDVDVDDEYVECTSRSGDVTRHRVRDCNLKRKIGERMKVFDKFISMFDSDLRALV